MTSSPLIPVLAGLGSFLITQFGKKFGLTGTKAAWVAFVLAILLSAVVVLSGWAYGPINTGDPNATIQLVGLVAAQIFAVAQVIYGLIYKPVTDKETKLEA